MDQGIIWSDDQVPSRTELTTPTATSWRAEKARATRLTIIQCAHDLFFTNGYEQTTIAQIAAAAHVAVQTVYDHALSKEALFFAAREPPRTWSWPPRPGPGLDWCSALVDSLTSATTAHLQLLTEPVGRDTAMQIQTVPALIRYEPAIYAESEAEVVRVLAEHLPPPQAHMAAALSMTTIRVIGHQCRAQMLSHPEKTNLPAEFAPALRTHLSTVLATARDTPADGMFEPSA